MGLYEFVWYHMAVVLRGYEVKLFPFLALFGWILLGFREVYHYPPPRISVVLYSVCMVSMIAWIATGFQFNDLGYPSFSFIGEFFNVVSKASIGIGYALHIGAR